MAGGGGTRLWPVSRRVHPKQALGLFGDRTLFQGTVSRLSPLLPAGRVLVVTVQEQASLLKAQVPTIPEENYIVEPAGRGTAAVVGLAAALLEERHPGAVMACLPADHFIASGDRFLGVLRAAHALALRGGLVTLGITPTYAATGYGYIQRGAKAGTFEGHEAYRVVSFKEKPARELAEKYLAAGKFAWNSGMFVWRTTAILEEIGRQMPDLDRVLKEIVSAPAGAARQDTVARVWQGLAPQTVDYGIMEDARDVSMIPADGLGWVDVGSWERLFEVLKPDAQGNIVLGEGSLLVDSTGCLVYREAPGASRQLVALYGMRDMIVVDSGDVMMVCPREKAEEIRRLVERIAAEGRTDLL
jgi:mannose-1-phosphate guanylyltransferase